jgi:hypothetical protein
MAMKKTKYIIFTKNGKEEAILFDDSLIHKSVAQTLRVTNAVVGAGFVSCQSCADVDTVSGYCRDVEFYAYGESISLDVKSRPDVDTEIINAMFFGIDEKRKTE